MRTSEKAEIRLGRAVIAFLLLVKLCLLAAAILTPNWRYIEITGNGDEESGLVSSTEKNVGMNSFNSTNNASQPTMGSASYPVPKSIGILQIRCYPPEDIDRIGSSSNDHLLDLDKARNISSTKSVVKSGEGSIEVEVNPMGSADQTNRTSNPIDFCQFWWSNLPKWDQRSTTMITTVALYSLGLVIFVLLTTIIIFSFDKLIRLVIPTLILVATGVLASALVIYSYNTSNNCGDWIREFIRISGTPVSRLPHVTISLGYSFFIACGSAAIGAVSILFSGYNAYINRFC